MLKLRLKKFGRKKLACYRIVLMESCSRRDGKAIKEVGFYNPITDEINLSTEEILLNLKNGAKPTRTVLNLLLKANILSAKK
jgi:small subunit ribosomal protein S16